MKDEVGRRKVRYSRQTKNNFILHPFAFILCLFLPACLATVTPPAPIVIRVAGSTSMQPLLADLAQAYSTQHPNVTFDLQGGGSQLGQTLVEAGRIDLGMVSRPPQNLAPSLRSLPIARDAMAIIVHPATKIEGLSLVELQDIFSGRLLNWQEVGGPAGPIQIVSREEGSGTRTAFETRIMDKYPVTPTAVVLPNSQAVVDFVAKNPSAIAYVSLTFVSENVQAVPIEGIPATLDTLAGGTYPLIRELTLIVSKQAQPELDKFIEFILSPAGQAIIITKWGQVR
jgi:phosphate transport system substrate-binding protein